MSWAENGFQTTTYSMFKTVRTTTTTGNEEKDTMFIFVSGVTKTRKCFRRLFYFRAWCSFWIFYSPQSYLFTLSRLFFLSITGTRIRHHYSGVLGGMVPRPPVSPALCVHTVICVLKLLCVSKITSYFVDMVRNSSIIRWFIDSIRHKEKVLIFISNFASHLNH